MQFAKICLPLLLIFSFSGCGQPRFQSEESAYIIWKTPSFRYADQGFIYSSPKQVRVEIYGSGQPLIRLEIKKNEVCSSFLRCSSKKKFNEMMLSRWYPASFLEDLFRGKPLFGGEGMVKKRNGFTQTISNRTKYQIHYSVLNNTVIFRDTINKIQLKVIKQ